MLKEIDYWVKTSDAGNQLVSPFGHSKKTTGGDLLDFSDSHLDQ